MTSPSPPSPPGLGGDGCSKQLAADGCLPGTPQQCDTCASGHRADLGKAGCTQPEVAALCKGTPGPPGPPPGNKSNLVLLGPTPGQGGLCLDGSPAGFYYSASTALNASQTWVIYLEVQ